MQAGGGPCHTAVAHLHLITCQATMARNDQPTLNPPENLPTAEQLSAELIDLLHQGVGMDVLTQRLAQAQQLPEDSAGKALLLERVRRAMALCSRLASVQQRESGMLAVIDSARDLSARLDLQELLRALVARARNMLGSHVSWLSTYDTQQDVFGILAVDGSHRLSAGQTVSGCDTGIVGLVKRTRRPFTTHDYQRDTRFVHDSSLDTTFREEGVNAIVGVPLLWEDEVIGLLFVGDRHHRSHTVQEISLLSTLATHAAVAIKNARAFEDARTALHSAQAAQEALAQHARRVQVAAEAHERMTSLLARGATLSTICEAMAQMLEGDVLVLDEASQTIGRGVHDKGVGPSAERHVSYGAHSADIAAAQRRSRQVGRSVVAYEVDGETCRLNAVIGGDDVLGAVLLFRKRDLAEAEVRTFERCASVVGVLLLSRERMEASRIREQAALLRSLLAPRREEQPLLSERAERLGLPPGHPLSLVVIDAEDPDSSYMARRLRAANLLPGVIFDELDGALVLICPTRHLDEVRGSMTGFMAQQHDACWRGVISRPAEGFSDLPRLHAALRRALPVLARIGARNQFVAQNEMALYATLFETHDQASLAEFLEAAIGQLIRYDEKRGTQLLPTLLTYFDTNQSATVTAKRLGIHVNTARQRLTTVEELVGSWTQATRALELHMALRLWQLRTDPERRIARTPEQPAAR